MALRWNEQYATGNSTVDEHHKKLFEFLNSFEMMMQTSLASDPIAVRESLSFLGEYARMHFSFEENCMRQARCPTAKQNETAHERFLMAFDSLLHRLEDEGPNELLLEKIHWTAENWIVQHIINIDKHLRSCIKT